MIIKIQKFRVIEEANFSIKLFVHCYMKTYAQIVSENGMQSTANFASIDSKLSKLTNAFQILQGEKKYF